MALLDFLFGRRDKMSQVPTLAPYQQQGLQGLFANPIQNSPLYGAGSNYLQNLLQGGPEAFQAFEAPYLMNFEQNIAPGIAERFAGLGTGSSGLQSSGLNNSLAQAGRSLQTDLAGLRSNLQMQALPQALGYAQQPYSNMFTGLGIRPFENVYQPGTPGLVGGALPGLFGGFGMGAGLGLANRAYNMFGGQTTVG